MLTPSAIFLVLLGFQQAILGSWLALLGTLGAILSTLGAILLSTQGAVGTILGIQ